MQSHERRDMTSVYECDDAKDAIKALVNDHLDSPNIVAQKILDILRSYGLTAETAATWSWRNDDSKLFGTLDGLGYALKDFRCQSFLFEPVGAIISNGQANESLKDALIVAFLEPQLRAPTARELNDEGFKTYMKWMLSLAESPNTRWAVDEAYEYHGGELRRIHDAKKFFGVE